MTRSEYDYEQCGVTVTQSPLTGHWVVNHGRNDAEGFRRKEDAEVAAQEIADKRRWMYVR